MKGELIEGFCPEKEPLSLSSASIYVPNRRAARALSTAFLGYFEGQSTLLPEIRTLGDADDNDFGLEYRAAEIEQERQPISPLERQLQLATLVRHWQDSVAEETRRLYGDEDIIIPTSTADAVYLAGDFGTLLTQITQEEADWKSIEKVVPENHAEWWRLTATFLRIVMEHWPELLAERGQIDPALNAVELLNRRAKTITENPPSGPVIVAGTTGSVPSTQALLKAVAGLSKGAIVLPGVDFELSKAEWNRLKDAKLADDPLIESQPQFGLARTLSALGVERENVKQLGQADPTIDHRNKLVSTALSLSDFTAEWNSIIKGYSSDKVAEAFSTVSYVEAANERQEALAIAVAMRETLTSEHETAALVTPDRNLARRVSMELLRFGIRVDDTAGSPLSNSAAVIFVRHVLQSSFGALDNPTLTSLLKSKYCLVGLSKDKAQENARLFEQVALRGTLETPQLGAFENYVSTRRGQLAEAKHQPPRLANLTDEDWSDLLEWCDRLDEVFSSLNEVKAIKDEQPLSSFVTCLRSIALSLAQDETGANILGEAYGASELEAIFEELADDDNGSFLLIGSEFPSVFEALLEGHVCRSGGNTHPRLHIYGPLEVRLLNHDRVILGGLNEDTWPQNNRIDAFLNRTIRRQLGLPSPERRTGLAAHDFQQLMGKSDVVLTRAARVDKAPSVASRWVQRLFALVGEDQETLMCARGGQYLRFANALDQSEDKPVRAKRPEPKPPVDVRPAYLPVTDIETWVRDPYALYAKRILKLRPLSPLERDPDPLLRGVLYHAIMQDYVEQQLYQLNPEERLNGLLRLSVEHIDRENLSADVGLVWKLRFEEIAQLYVQWEEGHLSKNGMPKVFTEIEGSLKIGEGFTLSARADRIEVDGDGKIRVLDYKTGANPTPKQARNLSPQLALEGAIALAGGFEGVDKGIVDDLLFVRLQRRDKLKVEAIATKDVSNDDLIQYAQENLEALIEAYQSVEMGYVSRHAPFKDSEMSGDYDHLARTREWSFGEDGGEDD